MYSLPRGHFSQNSIRFKLSTIHRCALLAVVLLSYKFVCYFTENPPLPPKNFNEHRAQRAICTMSFNYANASPSTIRRRNERQSLVLRKYSPSYSFFHLPMTISRAVSLTKPVESPCLDAIARRLVRRETLIL